MSAPAFLATVVRLISGVRPTTPRLDNDDQPVVFFANHSSHLDFAIIWASLDPELRNRTRPVAGRDYWLRGPLRRFVAQRVFNAVLIERHRVSIANNPLRPMLAALDGGSNLIVFPQGTRCQNNDIAPFKPGLFHLAKARPTTPLVPAYLENLNRILPRGALLPVPLIAHITFGAPIRLLVDESKNDFLVRAHAAVHSLRRS